MIDCDHCGAPPEVASWYITPDGDQLCKPCWELHRDPSAINRYTILSPPHQEACEHGRSLDQDCLGCTISVSGEGSSARRPGVQVAHVVPGWLNPVVPNAEGLDLPVVPHRNLQGPVVPPKDRPRVVVHFSPQSHEQLDKQIAKAVEESDTYTEVVRKQVSSFLGEQAERLSGLRGLLGLEEDDDD